jgi:tRNA(Arg) A34 adenosine deaminase TadA
MTSLLTIDEAIYWLGEAIAVAAQTAEAGHHPFGALLLAPDRRTVLLRQGNVDQVNHAESLIAREAAQRFSAEVRAHCILVSTVEPCAMCAGTQYWAGIGGLVYGMSERRLLELTGDHPDNPTLDLPCRAVFAAGQRAITVMGPIAALEVQIAAQHSAFWHRNPAK